jgi:hypothetical protein
MRATTFLVSVSVIWLLGLCDCIYIVQGTIVVSVSVKNMLPGEACSGFCCCFGLTGQKQCCVQLLRSGFYGEGSGCFAGMPAWVMQG